MISDRITTMMEIEMSRTALPVPLLYIMMFTAAPVLSRCKATGGAGEDISMSGMANKKGTEKHTADLVQETGLV